MSSSAGWLTSRWWRQWFLRLPPLWIQTLEDGWRQLLGWLPVALSRRLRSGAEEFILVPQGERWQLLDGRSLQPLDSWDDQQAPELQRLHVARAMQAVDSQDRRLVLGLPLRCGLVRILRLPAAARRSLAQIARFEMDRQTPFRPEQVYYDIREVHGPAAATWLQVQLAAVPRTQVAGWLDRLASLGLMVDGIDLLASERRCGFNLLPPPRRPSHPRPRRRLNALLGFAILMVAMFSGWLWQHNRHLALLQMRSEVAAQEVQLRQLANLQQQWAARGRAAGFLERRKQQAIVVLKVLDELSRRLPDDTSLQRVSIDADGRLSFLGLAPQAARLVDLLKNARYLGEPGFQGTILRDPLSGKERFSMTAQLHRAEPTDQP